MTQKQMEKSIFTIVITLLFLFIFSSLAIHEKISQQKEQVSTFQKQLEAEQEHAAVQEEEYERKITYFKRKNQDLEATNKLLTDYIQMKQQELEGLR